LVDNDTEQVEDDRKLLQVDKDMYVDEIPITDALRLIAGAQMGYMQDTLKIWGSELEDFTSVNLDNIQERLTDEKEQNDKLFTETFEEHFKDICLFLGVDPESIGKDKIANFLVKAKGLNIALNNIKDLDEYIRQVSAQLPYNLSDDEKEVIKKLVGWARGDVVVMPEQEE